MVADGWIEMKQVIITKEETNVLGRGDEAFLPSST